MVSSVRCHSETPGQGEMAEVLSPSFAVGTGQEELWAVGWACEGVIYSLTSFIYSMFIEWLLCDRHGAAVWRFRGNLTFFPLTQYFTAFVVREERCGPMDATQIYT